MYHDQVLSPFKTMFKFDAINITLGLPYIRISPDHGTGEDIINKNKANPESLIKSIKFLIKLMLTLKKSLGQNLLIDKNIINKILSLTNITNKNILEIGPGTGNLTRFILEKNQKNFY